MTIAEAAAMMADAIRRHRSIRGLDVVKDRHVWYSFDALSADYDIDAAEKAYREAAGEEYERRPRKPRRLSLRAFLRRHR